VLGYKNILEREREEREREIVLMHYPPAEGYQSSEMLVCFGWGGSFLDSANVLGG
jgi:hypothetical protein